MQRLVGDDADRCARRGARARSPCWARTPARSSRNECVVEHVVDDGAHVVRRGRARRAPRPRRARSRGRRGRRSPRCGGSSRWFDGQVREERREREHRVVLVGDDERGDAALRARGSPRRRARSRSIGDAGERDDDVGAAHVRERVGGHDHVVGDARAAARGRTRGPDERRARSAPRPTRRPAPWRRGPTRAATATPSLTSAPDAGDRARRSGCRARPRGGRPARSPAPSAVPIAPRCLPPSRRNQLTGRPSSSRSDADDRGAAMPEDGRAAGASPGRRRPGARISVALWPPNPNEFESTGVRLDRPRGSPDTTSRPMSSPICSRLAVGGTTPSRSDEQRDARLRRRRRRRSCAR